MYLNKISVTFLFLVAIIASIACVSAENVNLSDTQVSDVNVNGVEQLSSVTVNDGISDSSPANTVGYVSNSTDSKSVSGNGVCDVSNSVDSSSSSNGNSVNNLANDVSSNKILDYVSTSINPNVPVNPSMNSSFIQEYIDNTSSAGGGSIIFSLGNYYNISIHAKNNINLVGQNAVLYGNGRDYVIDVSNTNNILIRGFRIVINSNISNGISGFNTSNCVIRSNTILNGGDAINIFKYYDNVTIYNNVIRNMTGKWGDAISLVCHNQTINMDNWIGANIWRNTIQNSKFGIFLGVNAKGFIRNNMICSTNEGMHFQGKGSLSNGKLNLIVSANNLDNVNIGIEMEHPNVLYLLLRFNNIFTVNKAINTNSHFNEMAGSSNIDVRNNYLGGSVSQSFINWTSIANHNSGPGAYTKP